MNIPNGNRPDPRMLGGEGMRGGKDSGSSENQCQNSSSCPRRQYRMLPANPVRGSGNLVYCPIRFDADPDFLTHCLGQTCTAFRLIDAQQGYCKVIEDGGRVR